MENCCENCKPVCTAKCDSCGKRYCDFPMDTTVSNYQWSLIHPENSDGLLCAGCMVERGANIPGVLAARLVFEVAITAQQTLS